MELLLTTNPGFLVLPVDNNEFVFYNSYIHIGCRLTKLELLILDLVYRYNDLEFIANKFDASKKAVFEKAFQFINDKQLLSQDDKGMVYKPEIIVPSVFYVHLTYSCNLRCTYCYNREIRKARSDEPLSLEQWKTIIEQISPYAKIIVLTGGECFLNPYINDIVEYIHLKNPKCNIRAISNGMHDFSSEKFRHILPLLEHIDFSCDSLNEAKNRIGFNADLYKNNIQWIRRNYPDISITIASTATNNNQADLNEIESFCNKTNCTHASTIVIPGSIDEIDLMPSYTADVFADANILNNKDLQIKKLNAARIRCSAAKEVCSIAPNGDVYPCQSLHYEEFFMGNILVTRLENLRYVCDGSLCMPTVNDFSVCNRCNVKYICGGGCLASGYRLYNNKIRPNHLTCKLLRRNALNRLNRLNNRLS